MEIKEGKMNNGKENNGKKYHIFAQAPHQIGLDEFGMPLDGRERIRTILEGQVTLAEYAAIYGENQRITRDMYVESYDPNGYTIRIFLDDVVAIENPVKSHHAWLINSMLAQQGRPKLTPGEISDRSQGYEEISPDAAQFLMMLANQTQDAMKLDPGRTIRDAEEQGLELSDFLREEQTNPA